MNNFNMGQVLSRSFALMRDNLMSVGLFMLIIQIVASGASFVLNQQMLGDAAQSGATDTLRIFRTASYWLLLAVSLLTSALSWSGSVYGYVQSAQQRPVDLQQCFAAGFAKMFPMLLLLVLWWLGVGLGWVLLIVPGIMLITMWSVAIPAFVSEDLPVTQSFGRSRELTRGHRWSIFGVLLMVMILFYAVLFMVGGVVASQTNVFQLLADAQNNPLVTVATGLAGWAAGMFIAALLSALYLELTRVQGSAPAGHLSEVFV